MADTTIDGPGIERRRGSGRADDASIAGESALMCFFLAQRVDDRALPIFIPMSLLCRHIDATIALQAIRRRRRAAWIGLQPFEALLAEPLAAVRSRLASTRPSGWSSGPKGNRQASASKSPPKKPSRPSRSQLRRCAVSHSVWTARPGASTRS